MSDWDHDKHCAFCEMSFSDPTDAVWRRGGERMDRALTMVLFDEQLELGGFDEVQTRVHASLIYRDSGSLCRYCHTRAAKNRWSEAEFLDRDETDFTDEERQEIRQLYRPGSTMYAYRTRVRRIPVEWDPHSMAEDDGHSVLRPDALVGTGPGRWRIDWPEPPKPAQWYEPTQQWYVDTTSGNEETRSDEPSMMMMRRLLKERRMREMLNLDLSIPITSASLGYMQGMAPIGEDASPPSSERPTDPLPSSERPTEPPVTAPSLSGASYETSDEEAP